MHRKQFIFTVVLPIIICIIIGGITIVLNSNHTLQSRAKAQISEEKSKYSDEIANMKKEQSELNSQIAEYDKQLEKNKLLVNEVDTLTNELNSYTSDVDNATEKQKTLDEQINEKKTYLASLSNLSEEENGTTTTLEEGEYKCPGDIPAGRYKAEGEATIYIYDITPSSLRDKQTLSTIDSHSYTFDLKSGDTFKTEGEVKLTEISLDEESTDSSEDEGVESSVDDESDINDSENDE